MYPRLPPGYTVRSPTEEDIPAILGLMRDFDIAETGEADPWTPQTILGCGKTWTLRPTPG